MSQIVDLQVLLPNPNYQKDIDNTTSNKYNIGIYPVILPEDVYLKIFGNKSLFSTKVEKKVSFTDNLEIKNISNELRVKTDNLANDINYDDQITPVMALIDQMNDENTKNKEFIESIDKRMNDEDSHPIKKRKIDIEEGELFEYDTNAYNFPTESTDFLNDKVVERFVNKIIELADRVSSNKLYLKINNYSLNEADYYLNYLFKNNIRKKVFDYINNRLSPFHDIVYNTDDKQVYIVNYNVKKHYISNSKKKHLIMRIITFCDAVINWAYYCLDNNIRHEEQYKYLDKNILKYQYFYFFRNENNQDYWNKYNLRLPMDIVYNKLPKDIEISYYYNTNTVHVRRIHL